jgi:multiple sugar transport system permease protein
VLYAVYLGFTNLQLVGIHAIRYSFTGWANLDFLVSDSTFYKSLLLTVYFVVGSGAVGATLLGLVLAIAMQQSTRIARWAGSAVAILAWTLPPTTIAFVWKATTTQGGLIAKVLNSQTLDLLYQYPMLIVSIANAWSFAGLSLIMFAAALRNIPTDLFEAARLEGASSAQCLARITIPMLRSTIVTIALLMMLQTFANFTIVYLMTAGGPGNESSILPVYAYIVGFKFQKLGYAALLGDVMVILSAILGGLFLYFGRQRR